MNKIFRTAAIMLLLHIFVQNTYAQKKTPLHPFIGISSIYDSCQLACNLFSINRAELIATDNLDFQAVINEEECYSVPSGFQPGCLLEFRNQKWFLIRVVSGDTLNFHITNSNNYDIDAAIWGPIEAKDLNNSCAALTIFPHSCDYSFDHVNLNIFNPQQDDFYLLAVTNFSNAETEINLKQPEGGKVVFSYFCPDNISLNTPLFGNQKQNATNELKMSSILGDSVQIKAFGGHTVELLPGFSTEDKVVFEARIQTCLNTSENYTAPSENIICEDFSNHNLNTPHLYANKNANELVGTVFARTQPEYSAYDNVWKKMEKVGEDTGADRYWWAYREPYIFYSTVKLRSGAGCPTFTDTRTTYPYNYQGTEDTPIASIPPITSYANIQSPFYISSDLNIQKTRYDTYSMYLRSGLPNLQYRIEGGYWRNGAEDLTYYEPYNQREVHVTKIPSFTSTKDFYIDFTQDGGLTADRYLVTRNTCGGHFGNTTVFNRVADSTVYVHTYQADINVKMKLGDQPSNTIFGSCFFMGKMVPGVYEKPLSSLKNEYILDDKIYLRIKFQ